MEWGNALQKFRVFEFSSIFVSESGFDKKCTAVLMKASQT